MYSIDKSKLSEVETLIYEKISKNNNIHIFYTLKTLADFLLKKTGKEIFLVGGAIRNLILGEDINDIDITGTISQKEITKLIGSEKEHYLGTTTFRYKGLTIEYTPFRKEYNHNGRKPKQIEFTKYIDIDSERRDFTINAIYLDLINLKVIDKYNGFNDLQNKILKTIKKPHISFNEDYLRILRLFRFSKKYNLEIEENTLNTAIKLSANVFLLNKHNIRTELLKGIKERGYIELLIRYNILQLFFPEINDMKDIMYGKEKLMTILQHSLAVLNAGISYHAKEPPIFFIALLFHDIAKHIEYNDKKIKHTELGQILLRDRLANLLFTENDINYIVTLLKYHKDPSISYKIIDKKEGYKDEFRSKLQKLFISLNNNIEIYNDLQKLSFCDKMGNGRRTLKEVQNWQSILNEIKNTIIT